MKHGECKTSCVAKSSDIILSILDEGVQYLLKLRSFDLKPETKVDLARARAEGGCVKRKTEQTERNVFGVGKSGCVT